MAGNPPTDVRAWAPRDAFVVVSVAVVLAALLQIVVYRPVDPLNWWILASILVGYAFLAFVFSDGLILLSAAYRNWSFRRHIRKHPSIVDALVSLLVDYDRLFSARGTFGYAGSRLVEACRRLNSGQGGSPPGSLTSLEKSELEKADAMQVAWASFVAHPEQVKNLVDWWIKHHARRDTNDFYYVARMVGVEVATGLRVASNFARTMNRAGIDRLNVRGGETEVWGEFSKRVNALVDNANSLGLRAPLEVGVEIYFTFEHLPDPLLPAPPVNAAPENLPTHAADALGLGGGQPESKPT
ncbi:MAG TPA: hypothetical protein VGX00_01895 [Thermoplasmata archaeon]|nr:hypothetical protein [Thermoplasmata archaeon]